MEKLSVPFLGRFEHVKKLNDEFGVYKCRVMALGKNRNGSYFSRSTVDACVDTFRNVPVVGFIYEDENGNKHMAGHEFNVVEDAHGDLAHKSKCMPYGVVPADTVFTYEDVQESDGSVATYLCCDVILWESRYPELIETMFSNSELFNQSMEIGVIDAKKYSDTMFTEITKFNASALCLLGKSNDSNFNVEPCFPSSAVLSYSFDDEQFDTVMNEFKFALSECFNHNNINKEGGDTVEVNENAAVEQQENFETVTEVISKVEVENIEKTEVITIETVEEPATEPVVEPVEERCDPDGATQYAEAANEYAKKRKCCGCALESKNFFGADEVVNYHLVDVDDEYVYAEQFACGGSGSKKKKGRFSYAVNEDGEVELTSEFESMNFEWTTDEYVDQLSSVKAEYEAYVADHSYSNAEVEELRQFKSEHLEKEHRAEVDEVLGKFSDLEGNEAFALLKENAYGIDNIKVLEDKCFALRGRNVKVEKPKKVEVKKNILTNTFSDSEREPYGGLFAKFGFHSNN